MNKHEIHEKELNELSMRIIIKVATCGAKSLDSLEKKLIDEVSELINDYTQEKVDEVIDGR